MTVIQLSEVTDEEEVTDYYQRTINADDFSEFKQMFEQLSGRGIEDAKCQLMKRKGEDDPSVIVFRLVDGYTYELRGTFPDGETVEFKFSVDQKS